MEGRMVTVPLKHREQLRHLDETSGPFKQLSFSAEPWRLSSLLTAVDEQKRDCSLNITLLMSKMNVKLSKTSNGDLGPVIWELVQLLFLLPPVEAVPPVSGEALNVFQRSTIVPGRLIKLVGECCN